MRGAGDDAEIMGDQQDGDAEIALQVDEKPQDLRLDGDVERVVGSSAMSSAGPHISAMEIMTRWRNPPES